MSNSGKFVFDKKTLPILFKNHNSKKNYPLIKNKFTFVMIKESIFFCLKEKENSSKKNTTTFSQELFETATILSIAQREILLNHQTPLIKNLKKSQS